MQNNASIKSVVAVLDVWPGAAKEIDENGRTPVHFMMQNKAPVESVVALLGACPSSAKEKDEYGNTPLNYMMQNKAPVESVAAVVDAWPGAAKDLTNQRRPGSTHVSRGRTRHAGLFAAAAWHEQGPQDDDLHRRPARTRLPSQSQAVIHHPPRYQANQRADHQEWRRKIDRLWPKPHLWSSDAFAE